MKVITLKIPTTRKEYGAIWRWIVNRQKSNRNAQVLKELEKNICKELNSGYWDNDISAYMRKELTMGFPNGKINRLINKAYLDLR